MMSVLSTPECYRRAAVVTSLGQTQCDPLGDQNVWSTLFELESTKEIIMVATKVSRNKLQCQNTHCFGKLRKYADYCLSLLSWTAQLFSQVSLTELSMTCQG